jgi:Uma2 family endonuclease
MTAAQPLPPGEVVARADGRVTLYGISWAGFEAQLELRGDVAGPRITYLDGAMELMSPSKDHERIKSYLGCLVEAYALHHDVDLSPYGSWLLKAEAKQAGLEPDECYIVGSAQAAEIPDLAIEVVWTSGGLDKLEAYRRIGIREIWFWKNDALTVHVLEGEAYAERSSSAVIPGLAAAELLRYLDHPTALQAVRALNEALRSA